MKKHILPMIGLIASLLTAQQAQSFTYLLSDTFTYPNGNLFGDAGSPWVEVNSGLTNACYVTNGRVQLNQAYGSDAQSLFNEQNVQGTVIWSSFIINLSSLPTNAGGVYFATLADTNFGIHPAIFALTANAFPGTYRLGISTTNVDYSSSTGKGGPDPTGIVPVDLAPGIDYQVVYAYDMPNVIAYLSINPSVTSDVDTYSFEYDPNTAYTTTYALPTNGLSAAWLRQRMGEGVMQIDNLEVASDADNNNCGYCAVTAGITPQAPNIGFQPAGFTNYIASSNAMEVAASAIGSGSNPTYSWYRNTVANPGTYAQVNNGGDIAGASTNTLTFSYLAAGDAGTYYAVVANSVNSAQSARTVVDVITASTAPFFITPTNATTNTAPLGGSVTFTALAEGSGPINYEWYFNNGVNNTAQGSGATLTLSSLSTNQSGTYTVVATGTQSPPATSPNFVLNVSPAVATNISYLISLLTTNAAPTLSLAASNTGTLYQVTGVVTVATNLTTAASAEYYVQDSTGGIAFFVGDSTFRPAMGDIVTVTGVLSLYYDSLEIAATVGNAFETYTIVSNNPTPTNAYPVTPKIFPLGYAQAQPALTAVNYEGEFVMLTNVYFEGAGGVFVSETSVTVTNKAGVNYGIVIYPEEYTAAGAPWTSIIGEPIPYFAYSVAGVLNEYSTTDFELDVTRYSDIVTTAPPAPVTITNLAGSISGTNFILTWTAVPNTASYSVLYSTSVAGPWTNKLATGRTFATTLGTYTTPLRTNTANFYEITSP